MSIVEELRTTAEFVASLYGDELELDDAVVIDEPRKGVRRVEHVDDFGGAWVRDADGYLVSSREIRFWRVGRYTRGLFGWSVDHGGAREGHAAR